MSPKDQKKALIQYIYAKIVAEDWHGVSDAAMDIRELETKYSELKE